MDPGYAFAEFYLSLIAYFVLHMIFVISSDFVEAFNIPPLNIGIYVDKMAAIRALLMVIADIFEWGITQKACNDPGGTALKDAAKKSEYNNMSRRLGSLISFLAMLICRLAYIIIVYKSDNKSLSVFITLCLEGFWFGVFQMSFFAVGPEFNAITSLGIHTMGNFIFFLQVILQRRAKKKPKINCLYRVRVHAWIVVVTSFIALGLWIWFCYEYSYGFGDSDQFNSLVCVLKETQVTQNASQATANDIATDLAKQMRDATVTELHSKLSSSTSPEGKNLKKKFTKSDDKLMDANEISQKLGGGSSANGSEKVAKLLVKAEFKHDPTGDLEGSGTEVQVKIGNGASEVKGEVKVTVKKEEGSPTSDTITIKVMNNDNTISRSVARRIARSLAKTLTKVENVKGSGSSGTINIKVSIDHFGKEHVWSPFLLFIIGAFAEDFAVPGVLPFAFLDPEKANLVNYLTPSFFMTGAFVVFLVDSVFSSEQSLFGVNLMKSLDSEFKGWSEGAVHEWHAVWLLNIPKYVAFIIAMWSIHGTFARLRCIIQSRWRVLLLTMIVVVPRATLEVMGYVGVANYAIAASQTGDWDSFTYIALHDMLAMFCRFVYGKFAVGYNWTRVSLGYCLPKFRPRHKGFGFGFWWWVGRTLSRAWADTVKDFKADIKCYL